MRRRAHVVRLDVLPQETPMARVLRRRVVGERMMLAHLVLLKGFRVGVHRHENEQITIVQSGLVRFTVEAGDGATEIFDVGPGEVVVIPPGVGHGAEAIEESVLLDVFSPVTPGTGIDAASDK